MAILSNGVNWWLQAQVQGIKDHLQQGLVALYLFPGRVGRRVRFGLGERVS